jgi:hypothetical protein
MLGVSPGTVDNMPSWDALRAWGQACQAIQAGDGDCLGAGESGEVGATQTNRGSGSSASSRINPHPSTKEPLENATRRISLRERCR